MNPRSLSATLIGVAFVFVLLVLWARARFFTPEAQPEETTTAVAPSASSPAPENKKTLATAKSPVFNPSEEVSPQDEDAVEFVVKDGVAIAFGDVALGSPEPGTTIDHGWYRMPAPQLWPSREIPYGIAPDMPQPERIKEALEWLHRQTPIRFVPFQGEEDAINFVPATEHCVSFLGRVGGHQPIRLGPKCARQEILHEILHALGFPHEHSRSDRDRYVDIQWDNVDPAQKLQFAVVPAVAMDTVRGTPFSFQSIMLYPANAFARDKSRPTIIARTGTPLSPFKQGLSPADVERVIRTYGE